MISLPPHHWVSEGSWSRCNPAVFCGQVQKRRRVRAISSLFFSHLLSFSLLPGKTQLVHLWKLLNFFEPTPVMTCCRLAVAHSINCSCATWKLRAVFTISSWDLRAQNLKLFVDSYTICLYLDSVMPTHRMGSCLTRMGFSNLHITMKIVVFSSGKKVSVSSLYPVSSFTVVPTPCSNNKETHLGKK